MSKFIKTLIVINGILIPILVLFFLFMLLKEFFNSYNHSTNEVKLKTENIIHKDSATLLKQGVEYNSPERIAGSSMYYLPISVKNYEKEMPSVTTLDFKKNAYDYEDDNFLSVINILFLDEHHFPTRYLLSQKACILDIINPENLDASINKLNTTTHLAYLIVTIDTNKDGFMDSKDASDLYISAVDGSAFKRITSSMKIKKVEFINPQHLFISYYDCSKEREEYKNLKFAKYSIADQKIEYCTDIQKNIEKITSILNSK